MFGKLLNSMGTYGCDNKSGVPEGFDEYYAMCNPAFYNEKWATNDGVIKTGTKPEEYTTSLVGNKTIDWLKKVVGTGPTHPPFFAYVAPHAPHLPATPAPWYMDHPIGQLTAPITLNYNYSATDHHPLIANQPIMTDNDVASVNKVSFCN
jgi:N-acetylglucosamine-6-sulfatase